MDIERALRVHKDAEDAVLTTKMNAALAIDKEWCDAFYEQLAGQVGNWEIIPEAQAATYKRIPDARGLYMFVWAPWVRLPTETTHVTFRQVLYVGKSDSATSSIKLRYQKEYSKFIGLHAELLWVNDDDAFKRSNNLQKYLSVSKLEYWYLVFEGHALETISEFEKRLINLFKPPANVQDLNNRYRAQLREPRPAF